MAEQKRVNYLVFVPVLIALMIFGAFGYKTWQDSVLVAEGRDPDALPLAIQGKIVPDLTLTALPGKTDFTSADLKKPGVKVVNFWASWCAPCRVEHPNLMALKKQGLKIYGINYKDKPQDALGLLSELGDPFTALAADQSGRNAINWGVAGVPETFVIDGNGRILLRYPGPLTLRIIDTVLRPALAQAAAATPAKPQG
jgi:cytochrome c biogenesis protein CcmG/thiol:disulfide interchange protein DsbE